MLETQAEYLCHVCGMNSPFLEHCEPCQKMNEESGMPSLLRDIVYRSHGQISVKASCLNDSDDDSTISADSSFEEGTYDSEKIASSSSGGNKMPFFQHSELEKPESDVGNDFIPNLLLPEPPSYFEGFNFLLNNQNTNNVPPNYSGISLKSPGRPGSVSAEKLPSFANAFNTQFSNTRDFHKFVRASAKARNEPVPDLIPAFDSDDEEHFYKRLRNRELARRRLQLMAKNNNLFRDPFDRVETSAPDPSESFNRTSVIQTPRSFNKGLRLSTHEEDSFEHLRNRAFEIRRQLLKAKNNDIFSDMLDKGETNEPVTGDSFNRTSVIKTSRSFDNGLKPLNSNEETERKSLVFDDKSNSTTLVLKSVLKKNVPRKNKSNKTTQRNRVSPDLDAETRISCDKKMIKMQDQNSTLQLNSPPVTGDSFNRISVIKTSRSFDKGLKPLHSVEEYERKSLVFDETSKNTTLVLKSILKKNVSRENESNRTNVRNQVLPDLDAETRISCDKKMIKMQDQNSTLLRPNKSNQVLDPKKQDANINILTIQSLGDAQTDKEQIVQEKHEIFEKHKFLTHQLNAISKMRKQGFQQNQESHAVLNLKAQNNTEFCSNEHVSSSGEVSTSTQKELFANDNLECNNTSAKLLFQILPTPKFNHQEQVIEIQHCIDQKKEINTKHFDNNSLNSDNLSENNASHAMKIISLNAQNILDQTKPFIRMDKIVNTQKSDIKADDASFFPPRPIIEVKKIALPERRNVSEIKPVYVISSTKVSHLINTSCNSQTIVQSIFDERIQNATPEYNLLKSRDLFCHLLQANNSDGETSNFRLISDANNNLILKYETKELNPNVNLAPIQKPGENNTDKGDNKESKSINSPQHNDPVNLTFNKKAKEFSSQNESKDTNSLPDHSNSELEIPIKNGDNSNLPKQSVPRSNKISNSTEKPKKEVLWYKCSYCWKKFKTVKGFQNHMVKVHPRFANCSEVHSERISTGKIEGAQLEIKKEALDEEQNIIQLEKPPEQSRNEELSLLHVEEKWFSCLPCRKVIKNCSRMMEHLNDKHSGSLESLKIISTHTFKKTDIQPRTHQQDIGLSVKCETKDEMEE